MAIITAFQTSATTTTVSINPDGWKFNTVMLSNDAKALMKDIAVGKTAAIVQDQSNVQYEGYTSYDFSTYQECIRELISEGCIMAVHNEIDVKLGDRTEEYKSPFRFKLPAWATEISDGLYGNAIIKKAVNDIINSAGVTNGMDKRLAVRRLAAAVADYYTYDVNCRDYDMSQSIAVRRGVCYHFSMLFMYACKSCGIPCVNVINDFHGWNATCIDGVVEYTDVTFYKKNDYWDKYLLMTEDQCLADGYHYVEASDRRKILDSLQQLTAEM